MMADVPGPPDPPRPLSARPVDSGPSTGGRRIWQAAIRTGRVVGTAGFVSIALWGAVVLPVEVMVLVAPATGAFVGGIAGMLHPGFPRSPQARRVAAYAVAAGVLLVPFLVGLSSLGAAGAALFLGLLLVGSLVLEDRLAAAPDAGGGRDDTALRELLPRLSTTYLLEEWHASEALLGSVDDHGTAVHVRALLLDELTRRDPAGVQDWLIGRDRSPESYIKPDRDLAN